MNLYVITQSADWDEYEGFTVAAEDEAGVEQAIRAFIAQEFGDEWDHENERFLPLTGKELDNQVASLWPVEEPSHWAAQGRARHRGIRLIGTTAPDITEPGVLMSAFKRG